MALLDWENTFDEVAREGLIIALTKWEPAEIHTQRQIENLYGNTELMVEVKGK